jgi:RNA polymerase sigma factor (sigma-70 family)
MSGREIDMRPDTRQKHGYTNAVPDAELVSAARRGDKRAFVEIVARHQAMVCGIALAILGDFAASEDAGQEAFLAAWRKIHELRDPDRLRSWLAQIARNAALGQLRTARPHEAIEENLDLVDQTPGPVEAVATEEEAELVRQSLARLPQIYRVPLILYYREGQSVRAVAESLGISEDAVKQRLARGREMCRESLLSVIDTVLTKTRPSTIFTMGVAVAIGALAAPTVMAATAFGSAAAGATTATSSSLKTICTTLMTSSKAFVLTTAMVALVSLPIGYNLPRKTNQPSSQAAPEAVQPSAPVSTPNFDGSALFAEWRGLHEQYGTNAAGMPLLYKAIHGLTNAFERRALGAALISEWAQVDPTGGLAFFMGKGHDNSEREQFFREWLAQAPGAAVAGLMAAGSGWQEVARDCLNDIAHAVPGQVAPIVSQLPKSENHFDSTVRDAFAILAENGVDAARTAAEGVSGPNRDQALAGVASVWARTDLNAAIAWAKGLPTGTDSNEIIRAALVGTASVDPAAALNSVGVVPEGGSQMMFASTTGARVLAAAAQTDFDGTVAWLTTHPGRLGNNDLIGLAGPVTERLNEDAAGFLGASLADGSLSAMLPAIGSALLNESSGERGAVWDWLKAQTPSPDIKTLQDQVLSSAAWQDPMFAMQIAGSIPDTSDGNQQIQRLAQNLFNGGSALGRFDELFSAAPPSLQEPLVEAAFNLLRGDNLSDPQVWANRLSLLPQNDQTQGAASLARAWAGQDPADAITWANSLATAGAQVGADAAIAAGWAQKDLSGAATWVSSLPAGQERDKSTESLVSAAVDTQPAQAWNWALTISDPSERSDAASQVIQAMANKDQTTARQWIESGPFTPDAQAKLLALLQKPGAPH